MALKYTVAKIEDIEEVFRSHYKPVDAADLSKGYDIDLDGAPHPEDVGALKRTVEHVNRERDEAIALAKANGSKTTEEIEALRRSADAQIKTLKDQIAEADGRARQAFLDKSVSELAADLGGTRAGLLLPHLKNRLVVEAPDGVPLVRVLGKDGKASALSLEDLKTEFKTDELFAPVIQAGRASGSGTSGGQSSQGGAGGGSGKKAGELPKNATIQDKVKWLEEQGTPGFSKES